MPTLALSLTAKFIIASILMALIGYEQYWVYSQGRENGAAVCVVDTAAAVKKALDVQHQAVLAQRQSESKEAAQASIVINQNTKRLVALNTQLTNALKSNVSANQPVPDDVIGMLNSARGSTPSKS